jgi:hypothetical protein
MRYILFLSIIFMNLTCENDTQEPVKIETLGKWGGAGVKMEVKNAETILEFDCGHAIISSKLTPSGNTIPEHKGTYVYERGGPILVDDVPDAHPAIFRGTIEADAIDLNITITDQKRADINLKLVRNSEGKLVKCR